MLEISIGSRKWRKRFLPRKPDFSQESEVSQTGQWTESSQEETEHFEPWSRIFDEAEKRHETQLNALINQYEETEIQKTWLVLKLRTLFFLFSEKNWEKYS